MERVFDFSNAWSLKICILRKEINHATMLMYILINVFIKVDLIKFRHMLFQKKCKHIYIYKLATKCYLKLLVSCHCQIVYILNKILLGITIFCFFFVTTCFNHVHIIYLVQIYMSH